MADVEVERYLDPSCGHGKGISGQSGHESSPIVMDRRSAEAGFESMVDNPILIATEDDPPTLQGGAGV
jgi:hypothetical protein